MWYFTWILGLGFALAAGIINVLWLEATYAFGGLDEDKIEERFGAKPQSPAGRAQRSVNLGATCS